MAAKSNKSKFSNEILRIERSRYNILTQNEILSINFNEKMYTRVQSFIYVTVILGGFFAWSSSSDTSNIYVFLERHMSKDTLLVVFSILMIILLSITMIPIPLSMINIRKKLYINSLLFDIRQDDIFCSFVKKKIEEKENISIQSWKHFCEVIKNKEISELTFFSYDMKNYLYENLSMKKYNLSAVFYEYFSKLILLNQLLDDRIILLDGETERYTLFLNNRFICWLYLHIND